MIKRSYSWVKEPVDIRDIKFSSARDTRKLSPKFSCREYNPRIWDQANSSSCVAHAVNRVLANKLISLGKLNLDKSNRDEGTLSRAMTYYLARWLGGSTRYDDGCYIRDGIKSLKDWGACSERTLPYIPEDFSKPVPWYCYWKILGKVLSYRRLEVSVNQVKQAIADNGSVVGGFYVYESFTQASHTGVIPMPDLRSEDFLGGHAICYTGWDDDRQCLEFANSYGVNWGDYGYGWMPYDYVNDSLQDDFWTIIDCK